MRIIDRLLGRAPAPVAAPPTPPPVRREPRLRITSSLLDRVSDVERPQPFVAAAPMPGVVPAGHPTMAQDQDISNLSEWASALEGGGMMGSGMWWPGYAILAELSQRPEYRRIARVKANEMTRRWIHVESAGGESRSNDIQKIMAGLRRIRARDAFRRAAEIDGLFGRAHLYLDTGDTDKPEELVTPLSIRPQKINPRKPLLRLKAVEPIWTYPFGYNSTNPLDPTFYKPQAWWVMGQQIHASRMLTFVGREVPDILKPAYMFGGQSLTQLAEPYVRLWLKDRTSVSELVEFFSTSVLKTNMGALLEDSENDLINRVELFARMRRNRDVFMVDKETEDFENVSAQLGGLDKLQAQSQEHICSAVGMPLVKYTGITPAGLNASSDGEIRVWYDEVNADQEDEFRDNLETVVKLVQLSELGRIDEDLTVDFVSLWQLDDAGRASVQQIRSETAKNLIDAGVIDAQEERDRQSRDPDSLYANIDLGSTPAPGLAEVSEELGGQSAGGSPLDPLAKSVASGGEEDSETGANSGV